MYMSLKQEILYFTPNRIFERTFSGDIPHKAMLEFLTLLISRLSKCIIYLFPFASCPQGFGEEGLYNQQEGINSASMYAPVIAGKKLCLTRF